MNNKANYKVLSKRITTDWQLYVLLSVPLIWLIVFKYVPMYGLQIAFKKYSAVAGITGSNWIGFAHFEKFLKSPKFFEVLTNTLKLSIYGLVAGFPIPILLALALNAAMNQRYKKLVQFVTYMPYFISTVVLVGMLMLFTNTRIGIFNMLLSHLNINPINFMGEAKYFRGLYIWSGIWQSMGYNSIIYIAALSSIDQELHEAAVIDGANRIKRMFYIDLPGLIPTIVILLILNSGFIMNVGFEKAFLMQNPINLPASEIISTYVYKVSLASAAPDFSYSTAIGLFNSIINMIILLIVNSVAKKTTQTNLI
jgi:putative aldouronate transport system permease protein